MQLIRDIDLTDYMDVEVEHSVLSAKTWTEQVVDHFYLPLESPRTRLPWKGSHSIFNFRSGEVTLWAGINGHGKSMISGQAAMSLCEQGERVCLASMEMPPVKTMVRISRQCYGADEPTPSYIRDLGDWTDGKLWIYDHVGTIKPSVMLAVIRYSIDKHKITHFFVDNLMKVVAGEDSYNEQKDFVNGLCSIAKDTGCHIHLILHIKKLKDEETIPNKFDIKGTGAISDLVDNIFIVYRNKKKENKFRDTGIIEADDYDALLLIEKQRNAEDVDAGAVPLWFDHKSMQYMDNRFDRPSTMKIEKLVNLTDMEF